jgi:hypothetical protein
MSVASRGSGNGARVSAVKAWSQEGPESLTMLTAARPTPVAGAKIVSRRGGVSNCFAKLVFSP